MKLVFCFLLIVAGVGTYVAASRPIDTPVSDDLQNSAKNVNTLDPVASEVAEILIELKRNQNIHDVGRHQGKDIGLQRNRRSGGAPVSTYK